MKLENVNREFVDLIIDYCVSRFGFSKYQPNFPRFILYNRLCSPSPLHCGHYKFKKNVVSIFKPAHKSCVDLVDTVIHEYVHYLQSNKKYYKLAKKHGYKDHPYEIEAVEIAKTHGLLAKKWAERILKKKYKV